MTFYTTFILGSVKQYYRAETCRYQRQSAGGLFSHFSTKKWCIDVNCQIPLFNRINANFSISPQSCYFWWFPLVKFIASYFHPWNRVHLWNYSLIQYLCGSVTLIFYLFIYFCYAWCIVVFCNHHLLYTLKLALKP